MFIKSANERIDKEKFFTNNVHIIQKEEKKKIDKQSNNNKKTNNNINTEIKSVQKKTISKKEIPIKWILILLNMELFCHILDNNNYCL